MKIGTLDIRIPKPAPISQAPRSRKIALAAVACIAVFFLAKPMALLLWARIRILTSLPKTAIAEPMASAGTTQSALKELDPVLPSWNAKVDDPFEVDKQVFPDPKPVATAAETPAGHREQPSNHGHGDGSQGGSHDGTHAGGTTPTGEVDPVAGEGGDSTESERYGALRAAAESVRVQSAGAGLQGAVIDDKAVRIGEIVRTSGGNEFTLVAVLDGAVVLGFEGREFVVEMPKAPAATPIKPTPVKPTPKSGGGKP